MADGEREQAFVFVVTQGHSHVGLFAAVDVYGDSGIKCDVGKVAVTIVAIEVVGFSIIGYKKVEPPVVIEITPNRRQPKKLLGIVHSSRFRNLGEGSVAV